MRSDLPDVLGPGEGDGDGEADHFDGGAFLQLGSAEEDGGVGVFDEAVLEVGLGDLGLSDLAGPATAGDDRGGGG